MTVYTVHEPPPRKRRDAATVPTASRSCATASISGRSCSAPLWMLWHRLWLVLLLYLVATTALQAALWALGVSGAVKFAVGVPDRAAGRLRGRRRCGAGPCAARWTNLGLVVAPNRETAERRFFDRWIGSATRRRRSPPPLPRHADRRRPSPDVIGLFPEPQSRPMAA